MTFVDSNAKDTAMGSTTAISLPLVTMHPLACRVYRGGGGMVAWCWRDSKPCRCSAPAAAGKLAYKSCSWYLFFYKSCSWYLFLVRRADGRPLREEGGAVAQPVCVTYTLMCV